MALTLSLALQTVIVTKEIILQNVVVKSQQLEVVLKQHMGK
jgi:hypothetical protein